MSQDFVVIVKRVGRLRLAYFANVGLLSKIEFVLDIVGCEGMQDLEGVAVVASDDIMLGGGDMEPIC